MSSDGGHTPPDRGGRGRAALLRALKNAAENDTKVGAAAASSTEDSTPPLQSKGRGRYLHLSTEIFPPGSGVFPTPPLHPKGRAALLAKLKAQAAPGKPSTKPEPTQSTEISPPGSGVFPTGARPSPPSSESPISTDWLKSPPSTQTPSSISEATGGLAKVKISEEIETPVMKRGEGGKPVSLTDNDIRLEMEKGLLEMQFDLLPETAASLVRWPKLLGYFQKAMNHNSLNAKAVANLVLNVLKEKMNMEEEIDLENCILTPDKLVEISDMREREEISFNAVKELVSIVYNGDERGVRDIVEDKDLYIIKDVSVIGDYVQECLEMNEKLVKKMIKDKTEKSMKKFLGAVNRNAMTKRVDMKIFTTLLQGKLEGMGKEKPKKKGK